MLCSHVKERREEERREEKRRGEGNPLDLVTKNYCRVSLAVRMLDTVLFFHLIAYTTGP